ncbi:unnamed protein product [Paramecium primaurelia]|uniref:Uncharacterized protein n=1 Tax=Paramecium primaurelia TaxID=5886 RepID=A0A8S1MAS8_PARPR|nr:unnamed protein product [Paramecium primaurelia]
MKKRLRNSKMGCDKKMTFWRMQKNQKRTRNLMISRLF